MTDIKAKTIADSIGEHSSRLFTVETRAPAMIHQEVLRQRRIITEEGLSIRGLGREPDFSYSVSSTRAVPFAKMLQEARDPSLRAAPVHWGAAQRGMVPGDEIDDKLSCINWNEALRKLGMPPPLNAIARFITKRECAKRLWDLGAQYTATVAEVMVEFADLHKSIPNRMLAPYTHYNVLMTGTEPGWLNFFGLPLDGAADPIVRALAEAIWREWNEHQPKLLKIGEWHLPYADDEQSMAEAWDRLAYGEIAKRVFVILQKMSVARCAHLSYTSFETGERMTVAQCLNLYERLVGSVPIHASPAEHQATPDELWDGGYALGTEWVHKEGWKKPELSGNLGPGWIQLRKLLPNEAVAPLPEAHR